MRHLKNTKKFKRTEEERKRLWTDLSSGLINSGKIITFTPRAKWFRAKFDRLVTLVKSAGEDKSLAFRKVRPFLNEKDSRKLIEEIVPKLCNRQGGYTRQYKLGKDFCTLDRSVVIISE
jgi:large subunit ribosomal protein L17